MSSADPCTNHACDGCVTCLAGRCCGEEVVDNNLPVQGSWHGEHHAPLGVLLADLHGRLICHVCGGKFDALYAHVRIHGMDSATYRAYFGLRVTEPLASRRLREHRARDTFGASRNATPPDLTTEQRREIATNREQRLQAARDPEQMAALARRIDHDDPDYRAALRRAARTDDPGHECPECGALVCTWTGRASGYSTQRTLCGEAACLSSARSRAAAIANRKRWAS